MAIQKENPQAIAKLKLVEAEQSYAAAEAELTEATASLEEAQSAVVTANDNVDAASSQLVIAQQNLEDCTITAPADGFVTDWAIRVGSYVVPMPMSASGTFIDTSDTWIAASFPEQMLIHVELGQEVELAFKSNPGRLFRGRVDEIVEATGEGQFVPTGKLPSAASIGSPGYLAVKVRLHDPEAAEKLALGTAGTIAIYTNWGKPFAVISKVAIRMKKWLYFLPLPSRQ